MLAHFSEKKANSHFKSKFPLLEPVASFDLISLKKGQIKAWIAKIKKLWCPLLNLMTSTEVGEAPY